LSRTYIVRGRAQDALLEIEFVRRDAYRALLSAITYHALGQEKEWDATLQELIAKHSTDAYEIAQANAFPNQPDKAFD